MRFVDAFDRWVDESRFVTARGLGAYRVVYGLMMLAVFAPAGGDDQAVTKLPAIFYQPPLGPMILFDRFPGPLAEHALLFVLAASLVLLTVGWQTRPASLAVAVTGLLFLGFNNSTGKIDHGALLYYVPAVMAFSSWGRSYSVDALLARRRGERPPDDSEGQWAAMLLALTIGLAFATAGWAKLHSGWLDLSSHGALYYTKVYDSEGVSGMFAPWMIKHLGPAIWELADYATVLFELGLVLAALHRGAWRFALACAVLFHVANWLILDIEFTTFLLVYAAFLPWERAADFVAGRLPALETRVASLAPRLLVVGALGLAVVVAATVDLEGSPTNLFTLVGLSSATPEIWLLAAGGVVGALYLANVARLTVAPLSNAVSALVSRERPGAQA